MIEVEVGAAAQAFLYGARAGVKFTFGGQTSPVTINQLKQAGYIEDVPRDDTYWVPGLYRFTRLGESTAKILPHHLEIIPSPKMDAPTLVAAKCSCGYQSGSTTEIQARHRWASHVNAKRSA